MSRSSLAAAREAPSLVEVTSIDAQASDLEVALAIRAGSHEALSVAFTRWGSLIYTLAMRTLQNAHDADEVTQQTFVSAWSSRHLLRPEPSALPRWLIGIAKHRIADLRRTQARSHRTAMTMEAQAEPSPPTMDDAVADRLVIAFELERLGHPRATIVRRAYVEDVPLATIAEDLGMPLNTVKSHAKRGLAQLRERLRGGDPG